MKLNKLFTPEELTMVRSKRRTSEHCRLRNKYIYLLMFGEKVTQDRAAKLVGYTERSSISAVLKTIHKQMRRDYELRAEIEDAMELSKKEEVDAMNFNRLSELF